MDYAKESLRLHGDWKGKIEVVTRVPVENKDDLSLAYTPGVAQPCLEIQKDINKSYELTRRWNMCLVVTDGSAVLGLGDIGPEAGGTKPNCNKSRLNGFKSRYLRIKASTTYLYFSNHKVSTPRTGI